MDFDSLKSTISNLSLYDVKAGVRKVQNAVMNFTEMESKVREATNNEPWGASSSLMQDIANGTFNYQQLNEIMPLIYKRFTEKSSEEWRQIYKALQLLEFLIKNGSERVIDDARSHMSLIKMLRQFHYIDMNGKDQGINVRNRSKELCDLLSDVEKIRSERKKARTTRNKYGGYEGGSGGGGASGSRYGGFGSESGAASGGQSGYGQYSGGVYGDGGGFGGEEIEVGTTQARRDRFEEYDEGDAGDASSSRRRAEAAPKRSAKTTSAAAAAPPKPKQPEVDLFSFDDEPVSAPTATLAPPAAAAASSNLVADDDDFDDFQSAPAAQTAPSNAFAPPPSNNNTNNMFASISPPPSTNQIQPMTASTPNYSNPQQVQPQRATQQQQQQPLQPSGYQAAQPNYFTSVPTPQSTQASGPSTPQSLASLGRPMIGGGAGIGGGQKPKASGGDPFATLLGGGAGSKSAQPAKKVTMGDMAKQQSQAGLWGTTTPAQQQGQGQQKYGGGLDDLI